LVPERPSRPNPEARRCFMLPVNLSQA
jgi:hypothetical protein